MGIIPYYTSYATSLLSTYRTQMLSSLTYYLCMDFSINLSTRKDILCVLYRETTAEHATGER